VGAGYAGDASLQPPPSPTKSAPATGFGAHLAAGMP